MNHCKRNKINQVNKSNIFKEYLETTGICKKVGCRVDCKKAGCREECKNVPNTLFNDRNCRDRCDKDSSCTAYLLSPLINSANWCTTYTSVGLQGNGRENWVCWLKGK